MLLILSIWIMFSNELCKVGLFIPAWNLCLFLKMFMIEVLVIYVLRWNSDIIDWMINYECDIYCISIKDANVHICYTCTDRASNILRNGKIFPGWLMIICVLSGWLSFDDNKFCYCYLFLLPWYLWLSASFSMVYQVINAGRFCKRICCCIILVKCQT